MGNIVPFEDPTNYRRVQHRIKKLWHDGYVEIRPHAVQRMEQREIHTTDIQHLIRYGKIVEHSRPSDLWRYKLQGQSVDGRRTACIVEIDANLIIITVIGGRKRKGVTN